MDFLHRSNYVQNGHSIIPLNGFYRAQESCRSNAWFNSPVISRTSTHELAWSDAWNVDVTQKEAKQYFSTEVLTQPSLARCRLAFTVLLLRLFLYRSLESRNFCGAASQTSSLNIYFDSPRPIRADLILMDGNHHYRRYYMCEIKIDSFGSLDNKINMLAGKTVGISQHASRANGRRNASTMSWRLSLSLLHPAGSYKQGVGAGPYHWDGAG